MLLYQSQQTCTAGDILSLFWQESERSLWTTVKYLQAAVSGTAAEAKFACSDVSKFISVSPFAYLGLHFSGISEYPLLKSLINEGRGQTNSLSTDSD